MPGWERILSDADIRDVVDYIKTLSPQFATRSRRSRSPLGAGVPTLARRASRAAQQVVREAAVRQVPRHRRPRHRRGRDDVRGRLAAAAARRGSHRAVDVPRRRHVARHLPALPHRHVRHADAVVQGRGERRRDVGPRQLRRLARAQAGLVDDRRRKSTAFYAQQDAEAKADPVKRGAVPRRDARLRRCATRRSTSRSACSPA